MTPIRLTKIRSDRNNYVPKRLKQFNAISLRQFVGINTGVLGKKDPINLGHLRSILEKFGMQSENITERLLHILIDRIASNPDASLILPKDINTDLIYTLKKLQHQKIEISVEAHYKNVESESGLHILDLKIIHVPTIASALKANGAILLIEPRSHKHVHHKTDVSHDCDGSAHLPKKDEILQVLMAKITSGMIKATQSILNPVEFPMVQTAVSDYLADLQANGAVRFERYIQKVMDQLMEKGVKKDRLSEIAAQMKKAYQEYFLPDSVECAKLFLRLSKGPYSVLGGERIGPTAAARRLMEASEDPTINIRWYTGSFAMMKERSLLGRSIHGFPPFNEYPPPSAGGAKKNLEGSLATNIGRGSRFFQTFGITSYQKIFATELNEIRQDIFAQIADIRKRLVHNKPFNQIYEELLKLNKIEVNLINEVEQIIIKIKQSGQMGQGIPEELRDIFAPQNVPMSHAGDLEDAKGKLQKSLGLNSLRLIRFLQTFGDSTYNPGFARTLYEARLEVLSNAAGVRNVLIQDKTFSNRTYTGLLEMNRIEIDLISELEQIMEKMKGGGRIGQVVPEELRDILAPQPVQVKQMPASAPVDKQQVQPPSMKVDKKYIYRVKGTPLIYKGTKVSALLETGAIHSNQLEPVGKVVDVTTGLVDQYLTEEEAKDAGLELWQLQWTSEES